MPMREIKIRIYLSRDGEVNYLEDLFDLEFVNDEMHEGLTLADVKRSVERKIEDACGSFD